MISQPMQSFVKVSGLVQYNGVTITFYACIMHSQSVPGHHADIIEAWPGDKAKFKGACKTFM